MPTTELEIVAREPMNRVNLEKLQDTKSNVQKLVAFLYINNELMKKKLIKQPH